MSEINCLVLLNNPEKEILLNMDKQVTYAMFNDEVRKNLQIGDDVQVQFSYFDSEGDRVLFNSEEEFKEFLNHASTVDMMTIFAYANEPAVSHSQESSNIIHLEDQQEELQHEIHPIEKETEIKPMEPIVQPSEQVLQPTEEKEKKEFQPRFNVKYQIPLQRKPTPIIFPSTIPVSREDENKSGDVHHPKVTCDNCNEEIKNVRYKCLQCFNYDLCEKCEELKCKSANSQIHPDSHIFAKIPEPIFRPELSPYSHFPHNNPVLCHRFAHPCSINPIHSVPPHPHPLTKNTNNNNNNNRKTKAEKAKARKERRMERREEKKGVFQQRGEKIQELENRIHLLEDQISSILSKPNTNNNTDSIPAVNDNLGDSYDRKFWPFQ